MPTTDARVTTVALIGHRGSGKTTLAEHLLAAGRAVRKPGSVEEGSTLLDHLEEERRRRLSLQLGFGWIEVDGHTMNLVDAPGLAACRFERGLAIAAADLVVLVVDGGERLAADVRDTVRSLTQAGRPTVIFVNKVDRPNDFVALLDALRDASERPLAPIEMMLGEGGRCTGVLDLLAGEVDALEHGCHWGEAELRRWMPRPREQLVEAVAVTDDALLEDYLEYLELPIERVRDGLRAALGQGELVPVLYGAAARGFGVARLLRFMVSMEVPGWRPEAMEFDGTPRRIEPEGAFVAQLLATQLDPQGEPYQVFRVWAGEAPLNATWIHGGTGAAGKVRKLYRLRGPRRAAARHRGPGSLIATWDVLPGRPGDTFTAGERLVVAPPERPPIMMAYALRPCTPGDEQRLEPALQQLLAMDGSLELHADDLTGERLLAGSSAAQLDWAVERLARLGVRVRTELPPIPYREAPTHPVHNVEGVHRLEDSDGLPVEYGACQLDVEPRSDEAVDVEDAFPDAEELPTKFRPAINEGIRKALRHGPTAGYPILGAQVRLTGGQYDILQSTEEHFRIAGELATRRALEAAGTRVLEPWWQVDVYAPSDTIGAVIREVAQRRGRVIGMEVLGDETRICAQVPYRELRTFSPGLEKLCGGRARFFGEPSHYEAAPDPVADEAIRSSPFLRRAS